MMQSSVAESSCAVGAGWSGDSNPQAADVVIT